MQTFLNLLFCLTLGIISVELHAAVKGEEIEYKAGDVTLKGYMAWDDATEAKRPGIIVVHEWWGHNAYARKRAEMLAELGYTAFAVDMYGDGKQADHPKQAKEFMMAVKKAQGAAKERFEAALAELQKHPTVTTEDVSAIGYCFGGGIVLNMARSGLNLDGVASFHGALSSDTPATKDAVKAKILVLHGNDDKMIPPEQVEAFKKEMTEAGASFEFVGYPETLHSFTNPDADEFAKKFEMPIAYNKEADEDSWKHLQDFLNDLYPEKEAAEASATKPVAEKQ